jgi:hypothetical protein
VSPDQTKLKLVWIDSVTKGGSDNNATLTDDHPIAITPKLIGRELRETGIGQIGRRILGGVVWRRRSVDPRQESFKH